MAITPISDTTLPTADDLLKIKSVKHLPQAVQVPTMYDRQYFHINTINVHLVIRSIRDDIASVYAALEDPVVTAINDNKDSILLDMQALENRILALENALVTTNNTLSDHESRIAALEAFHP